MKKLIIIFISVVLAASFLCSCKKSKDDDLSRVYKMIADMNTYSVNAEIIVKGNRTTENYNVKQYFKYPDRYRIEVLSPAERKGKVTAYDGQYLWIYEPWIKQMHVIEKYKETEESGMFPGYFAGNLFTSEQADYEYKKFANIDCIAIKVKVPGGNAYRKWQILYISRKDMIPLKMEILDSKGNIAVTVYYKNFVYNDKIDDNIFSRDSVGKA
ncbi:MAG: outer-membrane lipoprotein carrier protein LolA [Clostridiales bacterium]|nr:outer-membrane lipoprotein carrier protein LolA [Clostridiales bacterium]HBM79440.1 hypothetical protein [Clostridiaceae bacterium]